MPNDPVLAAAVQRASAAVTQTAASPTNEMSSDAVAGAHFELESNIKAAIAPVIANATNTEAHWWQKRSMWSTLASTAVVVGTVGHAVFEFFATHDLSDKGLTFSIVAGAVWAGYSAYRAGTATTPLGTPEKYPLNKG